LVFPKQRDGSAFVLSAQGVTRVISGVRLCEEIFIIHFDALVAIATKFRGMAFPFGIMVRDFSQIELGVMTEVFPGKIKRFKIGFRKDGFIDIADRSVTKIVFTADKAAGVAAGYTWQSLFGDAFGFRGDGTVFHRKIIAFTKETTVLSQMVPVSEEEKLQRFHFVHLAGRRTGGGFAREIIQRLSGLADGRGDL